MKKVSKIVLVLVIVILLAAVGIEGFFLIKVSKDSSSKINNLESKVETSKNSNTQSKDEISLEGKSQSEIANDAIRKALKDEAWVEKNLKNVDWSSYTDSEFRDFVKSLSKCYILKLSEQNGMPVYIVDYYGGYAGTPHMNIVTYKDGKVVTSKTPIEDEFAYVKINKQLNQIATINEPTGIGKLYQVVDTEFSEFGHNDDERENGPTYFQLYGKTVSKEKFEECLNNMEEVNYDEKIELTDANIDKYVK